MSTRWLFKRKEESNNEIRYKARLVIRGYADTNNYDIGEVYAPVARLSDVRFLLIIANKYDLELHQLDVKTAFLNGVLEKEVFMEIPEGYEGGDELRQNYVCKLKKALYGLKVSPKRWYERLQLTMSSLGLEKYPLQSCMFIWRKNGKFVIILLYVDDILIASNCKSKLNQIRNGLQKEFEMTYLGCPEKFLGIEIKRDRNNRTIYIHQRKFIIKMLQKFKMLDCKPVSTPMVTRETERKGEIECERPSRKVFPFREAIGSLLYLSSGTRPDITYAVNMLSRKQNNYSMEDCMKEYSGT